MLFDLFQQIFANNFSSKAMEYFSYNCFEKNVTLSMQNPSNKCVRFFGKITTGKTYIPPSNPKGTEFERGKINT